MRILYIEDDLGQLNLLKRGLEGLGHVVLPAGDEFRGLELARTEKIDLILLDIRLHDMDGLALAVQLRAIPHQKKTLMLALTAGTVSRREHVLAAGCDGYLEKPLWPSDFANRIDPYLHGKREELNHEEDIRFTYQMSEQFAMQLREKVEALHQVQEGLVRSERLAAAGQVSLSLAHEINNPLQAVQSALELVTSWTEAEDKRLPFLELALNEVRRVSNSIHNLMDIYTPQADQVAEVDLVKLINGMAELITKPARDSAVQLELPTAVGEFRVEAAYAQIHQLLLNLSLNAIEAMPDGGTLRIELEQFPDAVKIAVIDTGPGLAPDAQLFKPFYTTKPNGHGLGLYICSLIAYSHSSELSYHNNPSGGATFTLKLPHHRLRS